MVELGLILIRLILRLVFLIYKGIISFFVFGEFRLKRGFLLLFVFFLEIVLRNLFFVVDFTCYFCACDKIRCIEFVFLNLFRCLV